MQRVGNRWCGLSFAPLGLGVSAAFSHGLRRGLHSFAALRLKGLVSVRRPVGNSGIGLVNVPAERGSFPQGLKPASLLSRSGTAESGCGKTRSLTLSATSAAKAEFKIKHLPQRWKRCATQNQSFSAASESRALPESIFRGAPENHALREILP